MGIRPPRQAREPQEHRESLKRAPREVKTAPRGLQESLQSLKQSLQRHPVTCSGQSTRSAGTLTTSIDDYDCYYYVVIVPPSNSWFSQTQVT